GSSITGGANTYLGYQSGQSASTGINNIYLGFQAGQTSTGNNNIILGYQSNVSGNNKVAVGADYYADEANTRVDLANTGTFGSLGSSLRLDLHTANDLIMNFREDASNVVATRNFNIRGAVGNVTNKYGGNINITAGNAYTTTGNNDGGDINITGGSKNGTGIPGTVTQLDGSGLNSSVITPTGISIASTIAGHNNSIAIDQNQASFNIDDGAGLSGGVLSSLNSGGQVIMAVDNSSETSNITVKPALVTITVDPSGFIVLAGLPVSA